MGRGIWEEGREAEGERGRQNEHEGGGSGTVGTVNKESDVHGEQDKRAEARPLFPRVETGPKWPRSAARLCT